MIEWLISLGYVGMLLTGFLAGSFFPFSSEVVMVALLAAGLDPVWLIVVGSIGNVAGGMFNYFIGSRGDIAWIEKYLHVSREKLEKTQRLMEGKGAWMGFFAFVPFFGSAVTIVLGLMRANILISITSITIGKVLRYILLVLSTLAII